MQDIPRRLTLPERKPDELAEDCDPMAVSQCEDYLAGIIACPDLIMPSERLPLTCDTENGGDGAVFQSAKQAEKLMGRGGVPDGDFHQRVSIHAPVREKLLLKMEPDDGTTFRSTLP